MATTFKVGMKVICNLNRKEIPGIIVCRNTISRNIWLVELCEPHNFSEPHNFIHSLDKLHDGYNDCTCNNRKNHPKNCWYFTEDEMRVTLDRQLKID